MKLDSVGVLACMVQWLGVCSHYDHSFSGILEFYGCESTEQVYYPHVALVFIV